MTRDEPVETEKSLTDAAMEGDSAEDFIAFWTKKKLGQAFYPRKSLDGGIDGAIELRDLRTQALTGKNLLVQVKSVMGVRSFANETPDGFSYTVKKRDLDHWMKSNLPIVLIVCRTDTNEVYWRSVKDEFRDQDRRASRKVWFNKRTDRFDKLAVPALHQAVARESDKRAEEIGVMLVGRFEQLGLGDDLRAAESALDDEEFDEAGRRWLELANALTGRVDEAFVWPVLRKASLSFAQGGCKPEAADIRMNLARALLDRDQPSADFELGQVFWLGQADRFPDYPLLELRAAAAEHGTDILDSLRAQRGKAKTAPEKREAAAALVDVLMMFGYFEEAHRVATSKPALKRLDDATKRQLRMDQITAAGELGIDVEADWDDVVKQAGEAGPEILGTALQRRAWFATRRGNLATAKALFMRAAEVWGAVEESGEQVGECLQSREAAAMSLGDLTSDLPFGSRDAAALAHGALHMPAARADRLMFTGLSYLADKRYPDALKHLTLAAMAERRAGDLAGHRRAQRYLARAFEESDELIHATRCWITVGDPSEAGRLAPKIGYEALSPLLRLDTGTAEERAASFAALAEVAKTLDTTAVAGIAAHVAEASVAPPSLVHPQPSHHARVALCRIAAKMDGEPLQVALPVLQEEIRVNGWSAGEAAQALAALTRRGEANAVPLLVDALLEGHDLPVSIAGWLKSAPVEIKSKLVAAATSGNNIALAECARADLPDEFSELRLLCEGAVTAAIVDVAPQADDSASNGDAASFGTSFYEVGDLARHASAELQARFATVLGATVTSPNVDDLTKLSALVTTAVLAPGLRAATAATLLSTLLPAAAGEPLASAPGNWNSHPNPKRARSKMTRRVGDGQLWRAALQACGRLAAIGAPASAEYARIIDGAVQGDDDELRLFALRELSVLPLLPIAVDVKEHASSDHTEVRELAQRILESREIPPIGEASGDATTSASNSR